MSTSHTHTLSYRIASSFPGRIRIQFTPAVARDGTLQSCAQRLSALPAVRQTRLAEDASSVIVRYDPAEQELGTMLAAIEAVADDLMESRSQGSQANGMRPRFPPDHPLPPPPGQEPPGHHSLQQEAALAAAKNSANTSGLQASGQMKIRFARDLPADRGPGLTPLLVPTLAVALAATEAMPVAITAMALALAAIPIARRAGAGVSGRKFTVDELDLANVAWLAIQGEFLVAGVVSWLISLGELIRGKTVRYSRAEIARLRAMALKRHDVAGMDSPSRARQVLTVLANAPLADTYYQSYATTVSERLSKPAFITAVASLLITRDPAAFIGAAKPRTDFTFGQGFSIPAALLNAMTATTREGPLFKSGSAIERLSGVDTVVFSEPPGTATGAGLEDLARALAERGIDAFTLTTTADGQIIQQSASGRGEVELLVEAPGGRRSGVIERLHRQGRSVAVVGRRMNGSPLLEDADVHITLNAADIDNPRADIVLLDGNVWDLTRAIDHARETMRILKQNVTLAAGASAVNFVTSLLQMSPAPVSSLINTGQIAAVGLNSLRPLRLMEPDRRRSRAPARSSERKSR